MDDFYFGYGKLSEKPLTGIVELSDARTESKYDLAKHPYFTAWQDPASGVVSYILSEKVAPVQFPFYFTNSSMSPDGEYLWFYVAFPSKQHFSPDGNRIIYMTTVNGNVDVAVTDVKQLK